MVDSTESVRDEIEWSADGVEWMFHAALKAGDVKGVEAAIRVMVIVDPHRAAELWDALTIAVKLAGRAG